MDTRNDSTLIPIPSIVDDARWIGRFSREVRKSITALRDRRQVMTKLPNLNYLHPFKLFAIDTATERRLYVGPGRVTMMQWNNTPYPKMAECLVSFNSGNLYNDSFGPLTSNGYLTLAASKTYGIWLEVEWTSASFSNIVSGSAVFNGAVNNIQARYGNTGGALIRTSETYTEYNQGTAFANSESQNAMIYIGKVVTDSDGIVTISQYRRSDVVIPMSEVVDPLVSADANNDIEIGTDGGLFLESPFISADDDNAIDNGTDGGWWVDSTP